MTVTRPATCVWLMEKDERCADAPIREAAREYGLSLCAEHYQRHKELLIQYDRAHEAIEILARWEDDDLRRKEREKLAQRYAEQSVVYYVRMRDLVKIGTTVNMKNRSGDLLWDEVLATEPGGEELERMRHKQFRHLRVRGERFEPGPDLMSHIAMIRKHFGEPQMTATIKGRQYPKRLAGRIVPGSGGDQSDPS